VVAGMSVDALTLQQAGAMLLAAVRDKSYRATPLGTMVGRFIRWQRNEY
jgi:hypothetical protein